MELSDAGRKVWERPYHPLYANNLGDGTAFVGEPGVPFGWVVAKDCLQGALSNSDVMSRHNDRMVGGDTAMNMMADEAIEVAMALCNKLAEEGL